jgi:hypothetical protein
MVRNFAPPRVNVRLLDIGLVHESFFRLRFVSCAAQLHGSAR